MRKEYTTNELQKKIPDVYELILILSKRARELTDGSEKLTSFDHYNKLTIATHEVMDGLLKSAKKPTEEDLIYKINSNPYEEKKIEEDELKSLAEVLAKKIDEEGLDDLHDEGNEDE